MIESAMLHRIEVNVFLDHLGIEKISFLSPVFQLCPAHFLDPFRPLPGLRPGHEREAEGNLLFGQLPHLIDRTVDSLLTHDPKIAGEDWGRKDRKKAKAPVQSLAGAASYSVGSVAD